MLGKLLGYEMKAYGRILVPIYIALIALAAILGISFKLLPEKTTMSVIFAFALIIYILLLFAVGAVTTILGISRYYNNMLGREGYLMFSLPVRTSTLMTAKTLAALIWTIFGAIVGFAAIATTFVLGKFTSADYAQMGETFEVLFKFAKPYTGHIIFWIFIMTLSVLTLIVRVYAAVSIGSQWSSHRLVGSILAYIGFKLIEVIIANIIQAIDPVRNWFENLLTDSTVTVTHDSITASTTGISSWALQLVVLAIILIELIVYWLLAWHFTDRKLNLA